MANDTEILKAKAIEAIKKNKLIFVEDICAMIGIAKSTFQRDYLAFFLQIGTIKLN